MPVTAEMSNHFKYMMMTGKIDFDNDAIKIILMDSDFSFDPDSHATLADVTTSQLLTGNGYTQDATTLVKLLPVTENDVTDSSLVFWNTVSWIASGGDIGPTNGAILYDDDTPDQTVLGYIDFGADYTKIDSDTISINSLIVTI